MQMRVEEERENPDVRRNNAKLGINNSHTQQ